MRLRVAVVGTGGIFHHGHLKAYLHLPEARIAALCDTNPEALKRSEKLVRNALLERAEEIRSEDPDAAQAFSDDAKKLRVYSDLGKMLADLSPDVVDICTPPAAHVPAAVEALRAGSNVMCEKPMARTWLEALQVLEAVEESGKFYQHNENWIWEPGWYSLRKVVSSGMVGEVVALFVSAAHGGPEGNPAFWNPELQGGGAMPDMAVHALTTAWFEVGFDWAPVSVKAAAPRGISRRFRQRIIGGRFRDIEAEDDAHFLVRFEHPESGAWSTAMIEGSWSYPDAPETAVFGTDGTARFRSDEDGRRWVEVRNPGGGERRIPVSGPTWEEYPSGYFGEIRDFLRSVRDGGKPLVDERVGAESQAVVGAAYLSQSGGGKAVSLDEFKAYARELLSRHGEKASQVLVEEALFGIG